MTTFKILLVALVATAAFVSAVEGNSAATPNDPRLLSETTSPYKFTRSLSSTSRVSSYLLDYAGTDTVYDKAGNYIIKSINLTVEHHTPTQVRIKMTELDENQNHKNRWEVPNEYPFPHFKGEPKTQESELKVEIQNDPFGFWITRKSTNEVIFDTRSFSFVYSDLYIDLTSKIPTENLFGLGERSSRFKMGPTGTYTIWARDKPEVIDEGRSGGHVYGHHPVYLMLEQSNNWHVVLFRSSNAMDVSMNDGSQVRYRVAGGIVDIVVFLGDSDPETAIKQYHEYVGKWVPMPFWSMGWHQSRWGYANLNTLKEKIGKYREVKAPIDVIWSDLDYMLDKEDFTIDSYKFPFNDFNNWLENGKIHWVPLIDAGVAKKYNHEKGYSEGINRDVFIKNRDDRPMLGTVWPGEAHYVDWFHPNATNYWADMIELLYVHVKFSGIWLDMNEPTNFANGEVGREWERSRYDDLPYTPGAQQLKTMAISMDGKHHGGIVEFNVHDLFGTLESKATYDYLHKKSPLPFILTRSSAFGAGQFAAHWTGDNGATWDFMRYGTTGVFQFGIYGMPFTGADICGFMHSTTPELCARWHQVGALYPFSRNHNHLEARDQEPWAFSEDFVQETAVKAIQLRYSLLKWYYAQFIEKNGTGTVFRPVMFEFPREKVLYRLDNHFVDDQIMLGSSLMAVPVYKAGVSTYPAYFPPAKWYNFYTGEVVHNSFEVGLTTEVRAPLKEHIPLFIRGGSIVHKQSIDNVEWTGDLGNNFDLIIAFNETLDPKLPKYEANGIIMALQSFDDRSVYDKCVTKNCIVDIKATAEKIKENILKIKVQFTSRGEPFARRTPQEEISVSSITILGLPYKQPEEGDIPAFYKVKGDAGQRERPGIAQIKHDPVKGLVFRERQINVRNNVVVEILIDSADKNP